MNKLISIIFLILLPCEFHSESYLLLFLVAKFQSYSMFFVASPQVSLGKKVKNAFCSKNMFTLFLLSWLPLKLLLLLQAYHFLQKCLFIWLHWILVSAHRIFNPQHAGFFSCGMWDLVL